MAESDQADVERLVEFWHTQDFGKLLDEAAGDVLAALAVTDERDRLRADLEDLRTALNRLYAAGFPITSLLPRDSEVVKRWDDAMEAVALALASTTKEAKP